MTAERDGRDRDRHDFRRKCGQGFELRRETVMVAGGKARGEAARPWRRGACKLFVDLDDPPVGRGAAAVTNGNGTRAKGSSARTPVGREPSAYYFFFLRSEFGLIATRSVPNYKSF